MKIEQYNLHGTGPQDCEVYDVPSLDKYDYWTSVTDIPCPVKGCSNTVLWYEAGYVPGYRVCMPPKGDGTFKMPPIHRFLAKGTLEKPVLVRDKEGEEHYGT